MDARNIYQQIDRAHRDFTPEQVEFLANVVRLYREEKIETKTGSEKLMKQYFGEKFARYADVPGLCKVVSIKNIETQGWSLNPGRYVGVAERDGDGFDFRVRLQELNEELETLNAEASKLENRISQDVARLLEMED